MMEPALAPPPGMQTPRAHDNCGGAFCFRAHGQARVRALSEDIYAISSWRRSAELGPGMVVVDQITLPSSSDMVMVIDPSGLAVEVLFGVPLAVRSTGAGSIAPTFMRALPQLGEFNARLG